MTVAHAARPAGPAAVPHQSPPLTVEIRNEPTLAPADAAVVRRLCRERPSLGVFLSGAWLSGYFEEPPTGVAPCLAIVREGGVLRAMIPLGVSNRLRQLHVTLLGGGAGSDRVDLLVARGYEARCADALLWWLGQWSGAGGFVLQLRDVPHDSPLWSAFMRSSVARSVVPRELNAVPYLDLREYRSDAVSGLPSVMKLTAGLARQRSWLEARGRVRIDAPRDASEALAAFDTLVRLLHERWQGHGISVLDDPARQRFHRRVIPRLFDEGVLRMMRVSVDLRTVAVFYGIGIDDWWGYYLLGYDREWAGRISLGRLTIGLAIDQAIQAGAAEFDFLKGAEPSKYQWPLRERTTIDADVFTSTRGAQLVRASVASRELGAALVNSARAFRARS